jgi:hypothetical protein
MRALARRLTIVSGLSATIGLMENSEVVLPKRQHEKHQNNRSKDVARIGELSNRALELFVVSSQAATP